jgi:hypothetical protein
MPERASSTQKLFLFAVLAASAVLGLLRLDNTYFWDDEALVGIVSKNLLATGRLTGWDGRNLLAYRDGTALDANLRPINAPLDFYVAAGSFWLLGPTTWAGRFPFVLAGLASLIVFADLLRRHFGRRSSLWMYANVDTTRWRCCSRCWHSGPTAVVWKQSDGGTFWCSPWRRSCCSTAATCWRRPSWRHWGCITFSSTFGD